MSYFSIQLNSNRPEQIVLLFDNIEQTADKPEDIEVLLHIDTGDKVMEELTNAEKLKRKFTLKVYDSDMVKGYATLWKPLNLLWQYTAPEAYFVINISDEMLFQTQGWDSIVRQYHGYYPDHVFRLRASKYRYRNYTDFWENGYAPDSLAFYTRKWLELSGDWNPCLGPDSFQQCVSFYLFTSDPFSHVQHNRDIPVPELHFIGEGAGIGLEGRAKYKRILINNRAWFVLMSHSMQQEAKRRAMRMKAYILSQQAPEQNITIVEEDESYKLVSDCQVLHSLSYHLSRLHIWLVNFWRMQEIHYYAGGGVRAKKIPFAGYFVMFVTYVPGGYELFYQLAMFRKKYGIVRLLLSNPHIKEFLKRSWHLYIRTLERLKSCFQSSLTLSKPSERNNSSWVILPMTEESPKPSSVVADTALNQQIYFSIQLSSNRPKNIVALLDNIESTATHPEQVEVLVHIDTGDTQMEAMLKQQQSFRRVSVRYIDTNLVKGFIHLWKAYNPLFQITAPSAYFVTLFSDEMRFETKGWDDVLRSYEGYYPDHIFRVRCSKYRYRNYTDFWENGFAPDSLAFYTRRWLALQGDWNPCTGPDSFQQCVAFYLFTADPFSHIQHHRDIVAPFLKFSGEGGGVGLEGEARRKRIRDNNHEWFSLMSHPMQKNARRRAMLLKAHILLHDMQIAEPEAIITLKERPERALIRISSYDKNKIGLLRGTPRIVNTDLSYKLSRTRIRLVTIMRAPWVHYYAGGGKECLKTNPWGGVDMMLDTYSPGNKWVASLFFLRRALNYSSRTLVHVRNLVRNSWQQHGFIMGTAVIPKRIMTKLIGRVVRLRG